ncbi:hypothetical protein [Sorangium sp. So ce854]
MALSLRPEDGRDHVTGGADDKPAQVTFTSAGTEAEPAENRGELEGLW